jgi:1-acyl-sn-glycerol-3-phosphate acyltransferase
MFVCNLFCDIHHRERGVGFKTKYNIHHVLGNAVARIICAMTMTEASVYGEENLRNLPRPYVLVMNHCSHWDPIILWAYYPDFFNFMIKDSLHRVPFFGAMSELSGNIPLKRDGNDVAALKQAMRRIKSGYNLGFFAEGTRSENGLLQPFKEGAVSLAARMRVPIVPVHIWGTYQVLKKHSWLIRSAPVQINILPPHLEAFEKKLERHEVDLLNDALFNDFSREQEKCLTRLRPPKCAVCNVDTVSG